MNWSWIPNAITLARVLASLPLLWLLMRGDFVPAFWLAIAAGVSDALDGIIAKRCGWQSVLGGVLDPIADKLLLSVSFFGLWWSLQLPTWLVAVVLLRDLVILVGAWAWWRADWRLHPGTQRHQQGHHAGATGAGGTGARPPGRLRLRAGLAAAAGAGDGGHHRRQRTGLCFALRCAGVARTGEATMSWTDPKRWQAVALVVLLGVLIWLLGPILTPFVIAALLGWLGDPMVDRLERSGRSRGASVALVFVFLTLALALLLLVLLPLLWDQVEYLIDSLPKFAVWATTSAVPWLEQRLRVPIAPYVNPDYLLAWLQGHWQEAGGIATYVLGHIAGSGLAVVALVANVALVPVLTFYFLRDWDVMVAQIRDLVPRPSLPMVTRLARESDEVLGGFLRGQFSVMVSLGTIYAAGLWMVGLDLGLLIGFVAGLVSFVPYLGAFVGVAAAVIATLVQHGDVTHLLLVLGVFAVGQTLESFVLTPWLVGDRIGLHPVAVIFAIMAGGQLFGFLGVLLALPVAAVSMVMLRHAHAHYRRSDLYGAEHAEDDPESIAGEQPLVPPDAAALPSEAPEAPAPYPEP